jgi:hypothetical protein
LAAFRRRWLFGIDAGIHGPVSGQRADSGERAAVFVAVITIGGDFRRRRSDEATINVVFGASSSVSWSGTLHSFGTLPAVP